MRVLCIGLFIVTLLLPALATAQEEDPLAWIERDRLRTAYFYARPPAPEKTQQLVDAGMNSMILKATPEAAMPYLREAKNHENMHVFLALNFSVDAEKEGLRQAVLADGRVERYACPLEERFWRDHLQAGMIERAQLANDPELQVDGLWIDFELYATVTGQRYYTNACYCDYCISGFAEAQGLEIPELALGERRPWLVEHELTEEYTQFLQDRVEEYAIEVRENVHAVNPDLLLGFYPTPHYWALYGVARAFSTERLPIILWATDTYGGGGPTRVPDDWQAHYEEMGVNARYCAGMLLRSYSAKNLAANIYHASAKCDGYWLFTTYTLWNPVEEHKGDYYLAHGTPEEYWQAIARANRELDRLAADPEHETDLVIGIEPIVYHPLAKPEVRRRIEALVPPESTGEMIEYDEPVYLRGSNLLLIAAEAGQTVRVPVEFGQVGAGEDRIRWEVSNLVGDDVARGEGAVGEDTVIEFTPPQSGVHYVLMTAGGSKYAPRGSNAPLGLYATKLHIIGGAERLYFRAPTGVEEFTVLGAGSSGRETIRVNVYDPAGELAGTCQSTGEVLEAPLTLTAGADAGDVWSLEIAKADEGILEDNTLTLPEPLPPVVSLAPEHAFGTE